MKRFLFRVLINLLHCDIMKKRELHSAAALFRDPYIIAVLTLHIR